MTLDERLFRNIKEAKDENEKAEIAIAYANIISISNKKRIVDDIFALGEDESCEKNTLSKSSHDENLSEQLAETNAILDNIECLLSEIAEYITESVQC